MDDFEMMEDMIAGDFSFLKGIDQEEKKFKERIEEEIDILSTECDQDEGCLMCGS